MPTRVKIALFGMGHVNKSVFFAGAECLGMHIQEKTDKTNFIMSLKSIIEPLNNKTLVDSYKKVQKKYYPEKDVYRKGI